MTFSNDLRKAPEKHWNLELPEGLRTPGSEDCDLFNITPIIVDSERDADLIKDCHHLCATHPRLRSRFAICSEYLPAGTLYPDALVGFVGTGPLDSGDDTFHPLSVVCNCTNAPRGPLVHSEVGDRTNVWYSLR